MFSSTFHDSTNLNGIPFSINGARNTFKKFDGFNDCMSHVQKMINK